MRQDATGTMELCYKKKAGVAFISKSFDSVTYTVLYTIREWVNYKNQPRTCRGHSNATPVLMQCHLPFATFEAKMICTTAKPSHLAKVFTIERKKRYRRNYCSSCSPLPLNGIACFFIYFNSCYSSFFRFAWTSLRFNAR